MDARSFLGVCDFKEHEAMDRQMMHFSFPFNVMMAGSVYAREAVSELARLARDTLAKDPTCSYMHACVYRGASSRSVQDGEAFVKERQSSWVLSSFLCLVF